MKARLYTQQEVDDLLVAEHKRTLDVLARALVKAEPDIADRLRTRWDCTPRARAIDGGMSALIAYMRRPN
jgi:hypothetical protein